MGGFDGDTVERGIIGHANLPGEEEAALREPGVVVGRGLARWYFLVFWTRSGSLLDVGLLKFCGLLGCLVSPPEWLANAIRFFFSGAARLGNIGLLRRCLSARWRPLVF